MTSIAEPDYPFAILGPPPDAKPAEEEDFWTELEKEDQAASALVYDPLEPWNRAMFQINDKLYFWMLKPLAQGYRAVTAEGFRLGVRNFFHNLGAPLRFINCLLQGKFSAGGAELARFAVNSTVGVLGFGDPAANYPALNPPEEDLGQTLAPDDAYLTLRGLRTLGVRLERHQANALTLANWLRERPEVMRVMYPALPDDSGHSLWLRDFSGACGLFGFVMDCPGRDALAAFLDGLKLFGLGDSWGGYESLLVPTRPQKLRTAVPWHTEGQCMRIHVGLEAPEDLTEDLARGFRSMRGST